MEKQRNFMMNGKIAIVGMEVLFGLDKGLDAFDRTVFDGFQHITSSVIEEKPKKTRKKAKFEYKEGYFQPLTGEASSSAPLLMRKVIDGALQNVISGKAENTQGDIALIMISAHEITDLPAGPENGKLYIADSMPHALQKAQDLLSNREASGVVIGAVQLEASLKNGLLSSLGQGDNSSLPVGVGGASVFLKRADQAEEDQDRVYAIIDAFAWASNQEGAGTLPSCEMVTDICKEAFSLAGLGPETITYLEVSTKGIDQGDTTELKGLLSAYQGAHNELTCALGCVKDNIEDAGAVSGLAGLIKTALCLYHRYIPAIPQWIRPQEMALFEHSPFCMATESRAWFLDGVETRRFAAISSFGPTGVGHLVLSAEDAPQQFRPNRYLAGVAPYCFPLAGDDQADLLRQLKALQQIIETGPDLLTSVGDNYAAYKTQDQAKYALMVVGHTKEELLKEIQFMLKGVPSAFETGTDLKMPKGSYFTANPLGKNGKVAFVYPGVGSTYIGLGQNLFHLYPEVYYPFSLLTPNIGELLMGEKLYPRSRERLTEDQIWKMELQLRKYFMAISQSGIGFFVINTMILKDTFKVVPYCAIGYSMGEPGMMASLEVWQNPGQLVDKTLVSPTFMNRLHGKLEALREYWGLASDSNDSDEKIWDCYTLLTTPSIVEAAIKDEERVFMTIINTAEEVVIAGDPEACMRTIEKIDCKYYPLSLDLVIHCDPTRLEHDRLVDLYTLPTKRNPGIKFYSSSYCKPIPIESKAIGQSIAKAFCETVDFPRLINQAYDDGARIFVEVGSRKFCCNLIDKILKGKEHLATPINVKGTPDQISIVRVLAQLVSHRVPVDLSPLF